MASELRVNTLKDAAGSNEVAMTYVANGSAKAWMLFNEPTATLTDGLNISSASDLGTGHFQHNFTNSFSTANFNYSFGAGNNDGSVSVYICTPYPSSGSTIVRASSRNPPLYVHRVGVIIV